MSDPYSDAVIEAALDAFYDGREWDDSGTSSINRRAEMRAALKAADAKRREQEKTGNTRGSE